MPPSEPVPDRPVSDCTAAELLEAAVQNLAGLGVGEGRWLLELRVEDGQVRRLRAQRWDAVAVMTVGRDQLGAAPRAA